MRSLAFWSVAFVLALVVAGCDGPTTLSIGRNDPVQLAPGDSTRLIANVSHRGAILGLVRDKYSSLDEPDLFLWRSTVPRVATVDRQGWVHARTIGQAEIAVTAEGITTQIGILVVKEPYALPLLSRRQRPAP